MKIKRKHEFKCCDPERVWEKLMDIDLLGDILADSNGFIKIGNDRYRGKLPVEAGPLSGKLSTTISLEDIKQLEKFELKVRGKLQDFRVSVDGRFSLSQAGETTTARFRGSLKVEMKVRFPVQARVGIPGPGIELVKKFLEEALKKLFRRIEKECSKEASYAH